MPSTHSFRRSISRGLATVLVGIFSSVSWAQAEPDVPDLSGASRETSGVGVEITFFESRVRPLFAAHCYECHGPEKSQANLRLDLAEGWRQGGDSGPAVVPGKPDESLLIRAIQYNDDHLQMPPDGKLPDDVIEILAEWVQRGAAGGASGHWNTPRHQWSKERIEEARSFWAYQPIASRRPPIDSLASASSHPIDCFVEAKLRENELLPNVRAPRSILIRRLTYDLHGLPPTPDEVAAFVGDGAPNAYERLVDRLLASPRFSEHWGRHWLDLVRFAESLTLRGFILPQAWRYRDYVINQFAEDRSYSLFLREQIAGDLLPPFDDRGRPLTLDRLQERRIATAFLALGNTNLEEQDKRQLDMDVVDEQLDVLGRAILGQTLQCARCHDHKFDPIPTRDYYALAGILRNTQLLDHANVSQWKEVTLPLSDDEVRRYKQLEIDRLLVDVELVALEATGGNRLRLLARHDEQKRLQSELSKRPKALSLVERSEIGDAAIHLRGSVHTLGELVPRGFLQVIGSLDVPAPSTDESGRRELADWISSFKQPLTPRVYVNRVWYWLLGQGLVRSLDQFGSTGQPPTHPELLDHLSRYFVEHEHSTQRLIRYIVLSETYRRTHQPNDDGNTRDPENRWLWRANRKRLEAESVRDTLRMVGDCLSYERGGSTMEPGISADYGYVVQSDRRSVYLPVLRNALPAVFTAFDFADPSMVVGQRQTSPTVAQSLFLMNDPLVYDCARRAAKRLLSEAVREGCGGSGASCDEDATMLENAAHLVLGRSLYPGEREVLVAMRHDHLQRSLSSEESFTEIFQILFASVDFRYRD